KNRPLSVSAHAPGAGGGLMNRALIALISLVGIALTSTRAAMPVYADSSGTGMTVEQALRSAAEHGAAVYAGDRSRARSPQDLGKTCTKLVEERGPVRAYLVGQTFSEFRRWLFLENGDYGWEVIATAPLDAHAVPQRIPWPNTGAPQS